MDLQQAFDAGFEAVKAYVDGELSAIERRLAAVEQRSAVAPRDGADGAPGEDGKDGAQGAAGRGIVKTLVDAKGHLIITYTDGTTEDVGQIVGKDGQPGEDGKDGTPGKDGAPGRDGTDGLPGENGTDGKDGRDGAPGKLPLARAWVDTVHREGDVVMHEGGTYQAARDTGKAPPHVDWMCLAAPGRAGRDADQIDVRGTYEGGGNYNRLNIVAFNGGAFIARKDNPGPCPGEDWQVIAMRGKPGPPGEGRRGDPGVGLKGDPGPRVEQLSIDGEGMLTLTNADGSTARCDLYPVLSKLGG